VVEEKQDRKRGARIVVWALIIICAALFVGDFFVKKDTTHFAFERTSQFYAVYGFVACAVLVLLAKYVLRPLVMRREDYYEE
jgi:hypothetical protein